MVCLKIVMFCELVTRLCNLTSFVNRAPGSYKQEMNSYPNKPSTNEYKLPVLSYTITKCSFWLLYVTVI